MRRWKKEWDEEAMYERHGEHEDVTKRLCMKDVKSMKTEREAYT
jgi:hypothetical protein